MGLDGGGTKTAACLVDENSCELGRGVGGPCNIATQDDASLATSLEQAAAAACDAAGLAHSKCTLAGACAAVAGFSAAGRRAAFACLATNCLRAERIRIEPDYVAAFWGASHGAPGIAVIAGTGAVSYGLNADGATHREDGLGYLLGDRGSAFNLGLRVLRHTLRCIDDGRADTLSESVQAFTGASTQAEMVQWVYSSFSPGKIASLAPVVGALAERGDASAMEHVIEMAQRLRNSARRVRHALWLPWDTPVYPLGGLWSIGSVLRSEFTEPRSDERSRGDENAAGGRLSVTEPQSDPAYGAALLALA